MLDRIEAKIIDIFQSGDIALKKWEEQSSLLDKANRKVQEQINEVDRETHEINEIA